MVNDRQTSSESKNRNENLRGRAEEAANTARERMKHAKDDVQVRAREAMHQAQERAESAARTQKDAAARRLSTIAGCLHDAGERLHDEDEHAAAHAVEFAADRAERIGDYMQRADLNEMIGDASRAARRHPEIFLAGAFICGLAIARFMRASSEREHERDDEYAYEPPAHEPDFPTAPSPGAGRSSAPGALANAPSTFGPRGIQASESMTMGQQTPGVTPPARERPAGGTARDES